MNTFFNKPKMALCFIISGEHILNKEEIWREWIEYNKDIINVYFYYQDLSKIKSSWILDHIIPLQYIKPTTYMYVIPAYMQSMRYALQHDTCNQWFCFLTDSCCPIISPRRFRYLFFHYKSCSLMSWQRAWWNPHFHHRANLVLLPKEYHLGNAPWFVLRKEEALVCIRFTHEYARIYKIICDGGLANESLFSIVFRIYNRLDPITTHSKQCPIIPSHIKNEVTHLTDWSRMSSSTSPYVFDEDTVYNHRFIKEELKKHKLSMFIRKIGQSFPDDTIRHYLYEYTKEKDAKLFWKEHFWWDHWLVGMLLTFAFFGVIFGFICRGVGGHTSPLRPPPW